MVLSVGLPLSFGRARLFPPDIHPVYIDKRYQDLNIEEVSEMVGFSTRQSFYSAFYKVNGITPVDFKKHHIIYADEKKGETNNKQAK